MTPLGRFLARFVPPRLLVPLLALVYATALIAIFILLGQVNLSARVYLDM